MPVIACGMVGSRQGWFEAPYRTTPCAPVAPGALTRVPTQDPRLDVRIAPGLKQVSPADVMRGEETQIAGALALLPDFDGVLCLPGTHTKWAHVSAGEVVSFQTFMTGEMFALLSTQSVLRHSMISTDWDSAAFAAGVATAIERPPSDLPRACSPCAPKSMATLSPAAARSRLFLAGRIGVELCSGQALLAGPAGRPCWLARAFSQLCHCPCRAGRSRPAA